MDATDPIGWRRQSHRQDGLMELSGACGPCVVHVWSMCGPCADHVRLQDSILSADLAGCNGVILARSKTVVGLNERALLRTRGVSSRGANVLL